MKGLIDTILLEKAPTILIKRIILFFHQFTEVVDEEEDDWDLSSLEEENPVPLKEVKTGAAIEKNDASATSMVHAWGTPMGKLTKEEGIFVVG